MTSLNGLAAADLKSRTMESKVAVVTGGTGGIGKATAMGLAKLGVSVVIVGRDKKRGQAAVAELKSMANNPRVDLILADLALRQQVASAAKEFLSRYDRLDVLINNVGGLYGKRHETEEGVELTLAVNHLCPFLFTHLLLPTLISSSPARIINVNSEGHRVAQKIHFDDLNATKCNRGFQLYGRAKLANLMFTYELARRLEGQGVTANALHPGMVYTELANTFISERFFFSNKYLSRVVTYLVKHIAYYKWNFVDTESAALRSIHLATSEYIEGVTGKYFNDADKIIESSPASYDEEAARRLWQISLEMTGLAQSALVR